MNEYELKEKYEQLRKDAAEMAKQLTDRLVICDDLGMELAEVKQSLKMSQMHVKEWQDKYSVLHEKIHAPWKGRKAGTPRLEGFIVRNKNTGEPPTGSSRQEVVGILPALDRILALSDVRSWALYPVFQGDIDEPRHVDEHDLEDGDPVA